MNRPKKIILTLLGIVASVGLGSLIAARPWATTAGRCWERAVPVASPAPAPFADVCCPVFKLVTTSSLKQPLQKKPPLAGYKHVKCDTCGEDYYFLPCYGNPADNCLLTVEELKHLHLNKEEIVICHLGVGSEAKP